MTNPYKLPTSLKIDIVDLINGIFSWDKTVEKGACAGKESVI